MGDMEEENKAAHADLIDLHKTAAFLTPYAVEETEGIQSESRRTFVNHEHRGAAANADARRMKGGKSSTAMKSIIAFQGDACSKGLTSTSRDTIYYDETYQKDLEAKRNEMMFFRKRDGFSEYAEAKARNPQLSGN
ncbi:unnamed protein product [Chrysoparadoxa australica]